MGAGADPKIGEKAAIESLDVLKKMLDKNTKMVFITAGMGGGTGTGAAPIISNLAMEMGILTVGIVTMPFVFEGKIRTEQANLGLEKLRNNVDSLVVINNNKLREMYGNLGVKEGFTKADEVLATAAKGIAEVITNHYTQNIDLKDAKTVLSNSGNAIMGSYSASGEKRALKAVTNALDSPLLNDNRIDGAQNVLLLIVSGSSEITIDEIGIINDYIQEKAGNKANIIMGIGEDNSLSEEIAVTVIATGFDMKQQEEILHIEPKKTIYNLEDENVITENVEKNQKPLQFDNASQSIDFKNIDFNSEDLEINNNHEIKREELLDIDVSFEQINKKTDNTIDSTIDEEILLKNLDDIEVVEPIQILKDQEKIYSHDENEFKHYLKVDINEIEVIEPMHIIPYVSLGNNSYSKNAEDNLDKEKDTLVNPIDSPIVDGLAKRTEQRRIKLKEFNYKFANSKLVSDMESEPAYKRAGISLDDEIKSSISSSTIANDKSGDIDIKSNNTFLHDNVD
tara:strand:- start:718 stop:2247 length:1530 start_codon:yes stop_codon:yes gene_type:complete